MKVYITQGQVSSFPVVPVVSSQPPPEHSRLSPLKTALEPLNTDIMSSSQSHSTHMKTFWPIQLQMIETAGCRFLSAYHHHGNSEVGSQLVVAPGAGGSIAVLIDAFFMHQIRVFLIRVIWAPRHPEACFKGLLELLVPLGVRDKHLFTWNTTESVSEPAQSCCNSE